MRYGKGSRLILFLVKRNVFKKGNSAAFARDKKNEYYLFWFVIEGIVLNFIFSESWKPTAYGGGHGLKAVP